MTSRTIHVVDAMTRELVKAWEDEDLVDVLKRMRSFGVRRVPVVARDDSLVGIMALDDIMRVFSEQLSDIAALLRLERRRESLETS